MTAKTDRELLELAAKAVGYDTSHSMNRERLSLDPPVASLLVSKGGELVHTAWNPLADDGDALRLAVKLCIHLTNSDTDAWASQIAVTAVEPLNGDPCAATRRAIVRAAAAIGETL